MLCVLQVGGGSGAAAVSVVAREASRLSALALLKHGGTSVRFTTRGGRGGVATSLRRRPRRLDPAACRSSVGARGLVGDRLDGREPTGRARAGAGSRQRASSSRRSPVEAERGVRQRPVRPCAADTGKLSPRQADSRSDASSRVMGLSRRCDGITTKKIWRGL